MSKLPCEGVRCLRGAPKDKFEIQMDKKIEQLECTHVYVMSSKVIIDETYDMFQQVNLPSSKTFYHFCHKCGHAQKLNVDCTKNPPVVGLWEDTDEPV